MHDLSDSGGFEERTYNSAGPIKPRPGLEPVRAFDEARHLTLQVEILVESYDRILRLLKENEWDRDEGMRTVLLSGLAYLDAQLQVDSINRAAVNGDGDAAQRINRLVNDLANYHSMYSVMKFKAYKLYKVNQVLEFNISGLRATESMWEGWADRMRRQQAEMQEEIFRLRALLSEFTSELDPQENPGRDIAESGEVTDPERDCPTFGEKASSAPVRPQPQESLWLRFRRLLGAG